MPNYKCDRCLKEFEKKSQYDYHINRKFPCIITKPDITKIPPDTTNPPPDTTDSHVKSQKKIDVSKLKCGYCGGIFSRKDALIRHINGRCPIKKIDDEYKEKLLQKLVKQLEEKDKIIDNLVARFDNIEKKLDKSQCIGTQNNIENQQINIINLVPFGQEDVNQITETEYKRILIRGMNSVPAFVEKLHFDKNKPENHNVYISNMRDDYVLVYDGKKWRLKNREDILQQLYDEKSDILETKFEELLERLDEPTIKMFRRFLKVKDSDDAIIKHIKKELKTILYDNRDMIKNTKTICGDKNQTGLIES
jgi:uncharacterized C2H2 Zn-finger protein